MSLGLQKTTIRLLTALLQHQAEIWLGKDAARVAAETLIDEDLQRRIDEWLLKEETAKQLLEATSNANNYFLQNCNDDELKQAISLGFGNLPSIQTALTESPKAMDSKAVKQALHDAFTRDLPNLTVEQCEYGAEMYTDALLRAVGSIEKPVFLILVQDVWPYAAEATNIVLLIRLILIEISIRPLAANLSSEFLVERDESSRANALVALAPYLSEDLKEQSLSVAREFKYKIFYTRTVQALIPHFNDELKVQVLTDAQKIKDEYDRACALAAIAPHLSDKFKEQALQEASFATSEIKGDQEYAYTYAVEEVVRANVLSTLPAYLNNDLKEQALKEAKAAAWEIRNEYPHPSNVAAFACVSALASIASHLTDELKEYSLIKALGNKDETCRARALAALAPNLDYELQKQALQEALSSAKKIKSAHARAGALTALVPHLNNEFKEQALQEALSASREIMHEFSYSYMRDGAILESARSLAALAPYLKEELKEQALQEILSFAREIDLDLMAASALSVLTPHLNNKLKEQALTLARALKYESDHVLALAEISLHLNDDLKSDVQQEALNIALGIRDDSQRSHALKLLASRLNDEFKEQILTAAREFGNDSQRAYVLEALAPHLTDELKEQALTAAREINHELSRARVLVALAPHLNDELKAQVLTAASEINDEFQRAHALVALAPRLKEEFKEQVLQEALYLPSSEAILKIWEDIQFRGLRKHLASYFRFIASKNQSEAIQRLSELIPALVHFSGREIANEVFRAIRDTARW